MKRRFKILRTLSISFLIIAILVVGGGTWFVRRAWPQVDGTISVAGLTSQVQVIRDTWGIPHIYAQNEPDLFFAQGYVHAQDRLWQMEVNRRFGSGTLSAVIGRATLQSDRTVRILGLRRAAQREWELLNPNDRAILESYAAGVNAYLTTRGDSLPVEFSLLGITPEPWTPIDTLVWGKVMGRTLGGNYSIELARTRMIATRGVEVAQKLLPPYGAGTPLSVPPEVNNYSWARTAQVEQSMDMAELTDGPYLGQGSNSWVVHGSRTASGQPLLANDTHLDLGMPSVWYANGLHGGRFNSVGFSFPGVPLILTGHNGEIAWGVTNLPADVQDLYLEKLDDPKNPTRYEFKGEWHDLEVIQETIEVQGADPVTQQVRFTRHGPLINDTFTILSNAEPLALRWTLLEGAGVFEGIVAINLATNWDEFRAALRSWGAPSQHFVYADRAGNIGYQAAGMLPARAPGHQGLLPMLGWTGEYEWQGTIDFDKLFSKFNPPEGFIATANDKVAPDSYPYTLSYEWESYRADRITSVLASAQRTTVEDMRTLQADTYSQSAAQLRPYLLATKPENDLQARALDLLNAWNLQSEVDQVGPAIFQVWYHFLVRNTLEDELGNILGNYEALAVFHMPAMVALFDQNEEALFDDTTTTESETRADILQRSLADAVVWLSEHLGNTPEQWTWGRLHDSWSSGSNPLV